MPTANTHERDTGRPKTVPNRLFREQFVAQRAAGALTLESVAAAVGGKDTADVARELGLHPDPALGSPRKEMPYEDALEYARVLVLAQVRPYRERFRELRNDGVATLESVAAAIGGKDADEVARDLGLRSDVNSRRRRTHMSYENALKYARALGLAVPCIHRLEPEPETYTSVPTAIFRERLQELGLSLDAVARAAGFYDGTTVARDLGLRPERSGHIKTDMPYEKALTYARALGMSLTAAV